MPFWTNLSFQDRNSPSIDCLIIFNDHSIIVLVLVTILVGYSIVITVTQNIFNKFFLEETTLEGMWTILPTASLLFIAIPSIKALYITEDLARPSASMKITGHQWYWSYEIPGWLEETDSFIKPSIVARLLISEPQIEIPTKTTIRLIITSSDVIHSWALPSAGVKVDANPGRVSQSQITIKRTGLAFGQCSEICGANHSFIPITIKSS